MTWDEMVEKAIDYFTENGDELIEVLNRAGIKEFGSYHPMSALDDLYSNLDAVDIFDLAIASSEEHYFDPGEEYFCVNGDGLLSSLDELEVEDFLDYDCIERIYREKETTRLPKYIERIFETYESDDFDHEEEDDEE